MSSRQNSSDQGTNANPAMIAMINAMIPRPEKHRGDDPDDPGRGCRALVLRVAAPCLDPFQLVVGHDPGHDAEDLATDQADDAEDEGG